MTRVTFGERLQSPSLSPATSRSLLFGCFVCVVEFCLGDGGRGGERGVVGCFKK